MDEAVLKAYDWDDLDLAHDFYEVDYLPENDRVRYTISPEARKEVLKRLLLLNHEIYEDEVKQGLHDKKKGKAKSKSPEKHGGKAFQLEVDRETFNFVEDMWEPPTDAEMKVLNGVRVME